MQQFNIKDPAQRSNVPPVKLPEGPAPQLGSDLGLKAPGLWSNLKDFLTERSVKVPKNAQQTVFRTDGLNNRFGDSLKAALNTPKVRATNSNMLLERAPEYLLFWRNLRDLISPPKLPPLKLTSKPVPVKPLWARNQQYSQVQAISVIAHLAVLLLIVVPIARDAMKPKTTAGHEYHGYLAVLAETRRGQGQGGWRWRRWRAPTSSSYQGQDSQVEHDANHAAAAATEEYCSEAVGRSYAAWSSGTEDTES